MSEVVWTCKKYGQITQVWVDGKLAYVSGNSVKAEVKNLTKLIAAADLDNIQIVNGDEQ